MDERVQALLNRIEYKDNWYILIGGHGITPYIQVEFMDAKGDTWKGRKWMLSSHMTDSEIVQTAFLAIKVAEEHEMREMFLFDGKAIFGPHIAITAHHEVADQLDVREKASI